MVILIPVQRYTKKNRNTANFVRYFFYKHIKIFVFHLVCILSTHENMFAIENDISNFIMLLLSLTEFTGMQNYTVMKLLKNCNDMYILSHLS